MDAIHSLMFCSLGCSSSIRPPNELIKKERPVDPTPGWNERGGSIRDAPVESQDLHLTCFTGVYYTLPGPRDLVDWIEISRVVHQGQSPQTIPGELLRTRGESEQTR